MSDYRFKFKKFVSFSLFFTFISLTVSGIALYIKPEGDIARWISWSFLTIDKKGWEGFHALFSFFFMTFIILHIVLNWKVLLSYLKDKLSRKFTLKKEFAVSLAIVLVLVMSSVFRWQPLWKISEWRQMFKKDPQRYSLKAPESGFSKKTMRYVAQHCKLGSDEIKARLKQHKIVCPDMETQLRHVAAANKLTPERLYAILRY